MMGVPPSGSGLRPFGAEPQDASQAKPLVPNAGEYVETYMPMLFERPVGRTLSDMRKNVRKTELYRRGDTVLVWVNEGDLYCDGPFIRCWRRQSERTVA